MKKVIISFLVAAAALMPGSAKADNLTADQAKAAAAYYLRNNSNHENLTANDMILVRKIDNADLGIPAAYFFNASKDGWIILAASSVIDPVMAYSPTGTLDADNLPANMIWFLESYAREVSNIQKLDIEQDLPDSPEWNLMTSGKPQAKDQSIILMEEYWDQGNTRTPTYNLYCPVVDGRTSVTGCVATALAQMCHYYRYPIQPKGSRTYMCNGVNIRLRYDTISFNYDLMPNGLDGASDEQIREVAKLCYAMGVGVKMKYHPDGSGSNNYEARTAMKNIFKYNESDYYDRASAGGEQFVSTIRQELLKKNIIYMTGASSEGLDGADAAGHAWLCAGYRVENQDMYFMNWGWGGTRHGNGFFNLVRNNMRAQGYNFNVDQSILLGLTPPDDSNRFLVGIREVDNTTLSSAYPNPAAVSVTIPYSLDAAADLCIYGIDGRMVTKVNVPAGNGEATIDVVNLPAGIYIYRLNNTSGKFIVK